MAAPDVTVVGVGASAGGLDAFTALLGGLPAHPDVAIVFVQHLAPKHESALVTLLSGRSALPVIEAEEGMPVRAGHVYVIPPNVQMVIESDELHLTPRPADRSQYTPIDAFLMSLATTARDRSVGIILSGTGSDGMLGMREIKAAGGITIAQKPASAKYDGMPRAAIAAGVVDLVLPPESMGKKLAQLAHHSFARRRDKQQRAANLTIRDEQLKQVFDVLRPASGIDFRHYKLPTIERRLLRRMSLNRINDPADYVQLLKNNPAEARALSQDLLIHVTRFFREPESFDAMARDAFPSMLEGRSSEQPIRAWVSGCATGEEAYSLAIALTEYLHHDRSDQRLQIFGTDVSEWAIEQARAGVYPSSIEADVSPDRLRRFFVQHGDGYRVSKMIRDMCIFARQDLTRDPPFSRLDLILCRNVLIYMDTTAQKKLLAVFHYALNPNGFLVLGQAETVGAQATLYTVVNKKFRIHHKKLTTGMALTPLPAEYTAAGLPPKRQLPPQGAPGSDKLLQVEVSRLLIDRFAPPAVVVDDDMQILQFRGQTGTFLEPAPGEASLNLLKMAREGLLYGLRAALHAARKSRGPARKDGLKVHSATEWKAVSVEVIPLSAAGRSHYLVLFDDRSGRQSRQSGKRLKRSTMLTRADERDQVAFLQRELAASRDYLQSIIQELEAANEELQSANEEILSSNEELQSTNEELDTAKEELQSTNEELNTLNEELHTRNQELTQVNSDLVNLLASVQIAIVIVGSDLRIRRFTPMAEKVLNLIPGDVDRSIAHINPNLDDANLEQLITECIDRIVPLEREVRDRNGCWYSLRIRPYRSVDNKIDGAVLALFDIDAPKRSAQLVREAETLVEAVLDTAAQPVAILEPDLHIRSANQPFIRLFSRLGDGVQGRPLASVISGGDALDRLRALVSTEDASETAPIDIEVRPTTAPSRPMRLTARVLPSGEVATSRVVVLTAASSRSD